MLCQVNTLFLVHFQSRTFHTPSSEGCLGQEGFGSEQWEPCSWESAFPLPSPSVCSEVPHFHLGGPNMCSSVIAKTGLIHTASIFSEKTRHLHYSYKMLTPKLPSFSFWFFIVCPWYVISLRTVTLFPGLHSEFRYSKPRMYFLYL